MGYVKNLEARFKKLDRYMEWCTYCHTEWIPTYLVSAIAIYWCIITFQCFFLRHTTLEHGEAKFLTDTRGGAKEKGKSTAGANIWASFRQS